MATISPQNVVRANNGRTTTLSSVQNTTFIKQPLIKNAMSVSPSATLRSPGVIASPDSATRIDGVALTAKGGNTSKTMTKQSYPSPDSSDDVYLEKLEHAADRREEKVREGESGARGSGYHRPHRGRKPRRRCTWGDRVTGCDARVGPNGRSCYDNTIRNECCYTCTKFETDIQGCKYGDRAGGCRSTSCWTTQQRYDCCATCNDSDTTWSVTGTITPYTTSEVTPSPGVTSGQQTSTPAWVIPVVAGAAGVIVVLVIILVACFLIRRRRKKPDAISDEMYKEYKMSKRAPVAPPRPEPEEERRSKLMLQDSAEYAYINPEDVQSDPGSDKNDLKKRTGNDPLPEKPKEYVYLTNPDKYGYLHPVERPRNPDPYTDLQGQGRQPDLYTHLHHANEEERRRQNSYGDLPQAAHYSRGNVVKSEKL